MSCAMGWIQALPPRLSAAVAVATCESMVGRRDTMPP
jgi:hypothetical protein